MSNVATDLAQEIHVKVEPNANHTGLTFTVMSPTGGKATLDTWVLLGNRAAFGPSDHVPSYSPIDLGNKPSPQSIVLNAGVALGAFDLKVDGQTRWSGLFQRFPITNDQAGSFHFVDNACVWETPAVTQPSNVVIVRTIITEGPDGRPCNAYAVADVGNTLAAKLTLRLATTGSADNFSLYGRPLGQGGVWHCLVGAPAADGRAIVKDGLRAGIYTLGPKCP